MEQRTIKVSEILQFLEDGLTRKDIADKYNAPISQINRLFKSHPDLKGKKPKSKPMFILEDDTKEDVQPVESQNMSNEETPVQSQYTQEELSQEETTSAGHEISDENKEEEQLSPSQTGETPSSSPRDRWANS